jgi:hypothetical protein
MICRVLMTLFLIALGLQAPAAKKTVDIVSVTGCLREQGTNWASGDDIPKVPPAGKNTFRLIGISEFNLPQMKDHTVVIRGLFIKDKVSRINVTSAVSALASCAPGAPK